LKNLQIDFFHYKKKARDPRFESVCGNFNEHLFNKSYAFLDDYRSDEINILKKELQKEKDPEEKEKLTRALNLLQQQVALKKKKEMEKAKKAEWKKNEQKLIIEKNKKPFYLKKCKCTPT
jgi:ribosomal RNA-processing protein 36